MTMTNANKRQRPAEATAAAAQEATTNKRHLEDPTVDDASINAEDTTDEDPMGVREDDGGDVPEAFKHLTADDFEQIAVVEISDDGDDPDADGDEDGDADADADAGADESRGSPADGGVAYGSYCGDGYSDAVQQCSDERRCEYPEDCSPLAAVVGYPLGCYADIACANGDNAQVAGEVQQQEDAEEVDEEVEEAEEDPEEPTASPVAPPEPTASPVAQPDEPTAAPVIPAEPTAAPAIVENEVGLEPTAAPIVPSTAAPAPVVVEDEDEVQDEDDPVMSEPTASPVVATAGDAETPADDAAGTVSSPEPTATPTQSPTDPAPVLVARETDVAGNTILYSCAEAAPTLTDPATGATAPSYQSMVVEFDYELYWNEGSTNIADANANADEGTAPLELTDVAGDLASGGTIGKCQSDCDSDDQCAGDLRCFQREAYEPVPGCSGAGSDGWDYCYDPQDEEDGSDGTGTRKLQDGSANAVLEAAVGRIAGSYLAELAEQYDLAGDDCSAIESAFDAADNNGNLSRKAMLRRTLMRRLQAETTVVEISDGGDVIDDGKSSLN